MADIWALVHAERDALIEDLAGIETKAWSWPSLCEKWTVHDVVAHLVNNAKTTRLGFVGSLAAARFDFDRQNAQGVARERGDSPQDTVESLRQVARRRTGPPAPLDTRLVEEIVHGEDIRRPLGITRRYPDDAAARIPRS